MLVHKAAVFQESKSKAATHCRPSLRGHTGSLPPYSVSQSKPQSSLHTGDGVETLLLMKEGANLHCKGTVDTETWLIEIMTVIISHTALGFGSA